MNEKMIEPRFLACTTPRRLSRRNSGRCGQPLRLTMLLPSLALIAACGQSNKDQLQEAANQSDPAAAAVLNGAAENGTDPQDALAAAGQAAANSNSEMSAGGNVATNSVSPTGAGHTGADAGPANGTAANQADGR